MYPSVSDATLGAFNSNRTSQTREGSNGSGCESVLTRTQPMDDRLFLRRREHTNFERDTPNVSTKKIGAHNGKGNSKDSNGYSHRRTSSIPIQSHNGTTPQLCNGNETRRKKLFGDTSAIIARHLAKDQTDGMDSHYRILLELCDFVKNSPAKMQGQHTAPRCDSHDKNGKEEMDDPKDVINKLCASFKRIGKGLEEKYNEKVDGLFCKMRNIVKQDTIDPHIRYKFLELIELRASNWRPAKRESFQGNKKFESHNNDPATDQLSDRSSSNDNENEKNYRNPTNPRTPRSVTFAPLNATPQSPPTTTNNTHQDAFKVDLLINADDAQNKDQMNNPDSTASLPTVNKYAMKDQIFIKASDAGRVMGVKGKRIHQIEEISNTIISFQKDFQNNEREVTICGPEEDAIKNAKLLIRETIRRNCSPTREFLNCSSDSTETSLGILSEKGTPFTNGHVSSNRAGSRRDCCCRYDRCSSCGSSCCEEQDLNNDFYRNNSLNANRCVECSGHQNGLQRRKSAGVGQQQYHNNIFGGRQTSSTSGGRYLPSQYYNVVQYYKKEGVGPLLDPPAYANPTNKMAAVLYSSKKYALDDSLLDLRSIEKSGEEHPNPHYHGRHFHHHHHANYYHGNHAQGNERYHGSHNHHQHHHHYHGSTNPPLYRNRFGSDSSAQGSVGPITKCLQCRPNQMDHSTGGDNHSAVRSGHYFYYQSPTAVEDEHDLHGNAKRNYGGGKRNSFGPINSHLMHIPNNFKALGNNVEGKSMPRLQRTKSFTAPICHIASDTTTDELLVSSTTKRGGVGTTPKCSLQIGETTLTLQGKQSEILEVAKNVLERYFEVGKDGKEAGDVLPNPEKWKVDAVTTACAGDEHLSKSFRTITYARDSKGVFDENDIMHEGYNEHRFKPLLKRSYSFHHAHSRDAKSATTLGRRLCNETEYPATMVIGGTRQQRQQHTTTLFLQHQLSGGARETGQKSPTEFIPPIKKYQVGISKDPHVKPIPKDVTRVAYTRDFMIKCAFSPFSRVTPKDLPRISRLAPFLIRHTPQDPTFYLRPKAMFSANAPSKLSPTGVHGMIPITPPTLVRSPNSNNPLVNSGIVYQLEPHFNGPPFPLNIIPNGNAPRASPSLLGVAPYPPPPPPQLGSVGPAPPYMRSSSGVGSQGGKNSPYFI